MENILFRKSPWKRCCLSVTLGKGTLFLCGWCSEKDSAENSQLSMLLLTAKSLQSCPTLWDPIPGILQARTLEWVAISFSSAEKWKVKVKSLSHVWLFATPWTAAYQAPPSMEFSRQEYWSGVVYAPRSWQKESLHLAGSSRLRTAVTTLLIWTPVALKLEGALESPRGLFKPDFWAPSPDYLT